jgi:hypothetical protein
MTLRRGHGRGRGKPRVEVLPPDELPSAMPSESARAERDAGGRFIAGNGIAKMRRAKTTIAGLRVDTSCQAYKPFGRFGRRYGAHRRTELARAHGGSISAGVGALIESAALALSASRFLHDKASQTGDALLFVTAARLATDARQHELAAWELSAREAQARATAPALPQAVEQRLRDVIAERESRSHNAHRTPGKESLSEPEAPEGQPNPSTRPRATSGQAASTRRSEP